MTTHETADLFAPAKNSVTWSGQGGNYGVRTGADDRTAPILPDLDYVLEPTVNELDDLQISWAYEDPSSGGRDTAGADDQKPAFDVPTLLSPVPFQAAGSTTEQRDSTKSPRHYIPTLTPDERARSYLNGEMLKLARGVEGIIRDTDRAVRTYISSFRVTTRRFEDSRNVELMFTVHTRMNPDQALAFWEGIEMRLGDWASRLPPLARRLLNERTALSVEWVEPGAD